MNSGQSPTSSSDQEKAFLDVDTIEEGYSTHQDPIHEGKSFFDKTDPDIKVGLFLDHLPKVSEKRLEIEHALRRLDQQNPLVETLAWMEPRWRHNLKIESPEIYWKLTGTLRPGVIAQCAWPRFHARLALGVETSIAHAVVDGLLGYQRMIGEERRQVSPVEHGIWTYLLQQSLARLKTKFGPMGSWDFSIERVGPQAFQPETTDGWVTIFWPMRVGSISGGIRLWAPESLAFEWSHRVALSNDNARQTLDPTRALQQYGNCSSVWRLEAGTIALGESQEPSDLKPNQTYRLENTALKGQPDNPEGELQLTINLDGSFHTAVVALVDGFNAIKLVTRPQIHQIANGSGTAEPGSNSSIQSTWSKRPQPTREISSFDSDFSFDPQLGVAISSPNKMSGSSNWSSTVEKDSKSLIPAPSTLSGHKEHPMAANDNAPHFSSDLPVTLVVEVGRINLSLSKLADLRPGDTLKLPRDPKDPVEITSNGTLVARGELVLLDDQLGVRITNVLL